MRLAKARDFAKLYPDELSSEAGAYVKASRARANRGLRRALGAAVLFAAVAVGAVVFAKMARDQFVAAEAAKVEAQSQRDVADAAKVEAQNQRDVAEAARGEADRNFQVANQAINSLVFDIAQGLRNVSGMRTEFDPHDSGDRANGPRSTERRLAARYEVAASSRGDA